MWCFRSTRNVSFAIVLTAMTVAGNASAWAIERTGGQDILLRQRALNLQTLQSRQQRRDFQQQLQWNRDLDRLTNGRPQQRLQIPNVAPNCQVQPFGNAYLGRTCR